MGSLNLKNVSKSFGNVNVLREIDLDIEHGEFVIIVGPSGCGKSTLLRIIAGLEDASSGEVLIDGDLVNLTPPAKRGIAMVFQTYALYPHLNIKKNMSLGLKQAKTDEAEIEERVAFASNMLSLNEYLERRPAELSGGQRQRVAIGRALVRNPKLFLFDEPLSNLDAALRVNTRIEIAKLHQKLDSTMIYVTHDQVEAMTLADRIVILNGGNVEQVGSPMELYNNPINKFVAGFIGSPQMNFLDLSKLKLGKISKRKNSNKAATLGIRPEHISLDNKSGDVEGTITYVEQLGGDTNIYIEIENVGSLIVRLFREHKFKLNSKIYMNFPDEFIYIFDENDITL